VTTTVLQGYRFSPDPTPAQEAALRSPFPVVLVDGPHEEEVQRDRPGVPGLGPSTVDVLAADHVHVCAFDVAVHGSVVRQQV
jgi:hypothetical protein